MAGQLQKDALCRFGVEQLCEYLVLPGRLWLSTESSLFRH